MIPFICFVRSMILLGFFLNIATPFPDFFICYFTKVGKINENVHSFKC